MSEVTVVIGPGLIGQAIARRVSVGKHVLLADLKEENAAEAAETLDNAGYEVSVATVDVSSRDDVEGLVATASGLGDVTGLTPPAFHPLRPRSRRSCMSTCTAPHSRWSSSAT